MLSYVTLGVHDLAANGTFYDQALAPLGIVALKRADYEIGYGPAGGETELWIVHPYNELPASYGNGTMVCLHAPSRQAVDAFHAAGCAHGGFDEGAPGPRRYGPNFYAAYLRDPSGNKLSAVYNKPA
jgi:catechol 2,3-dioxygenase-like lactoylglutathione lyase family enzyme